MNTNPKPIVLNNGNVVHPKIREVAVGDKIVTEAHYIDPQSGMFVQKVTLGVKDAPKEDK